MQANFPLLLQSSLTSMPHTAALSPLSAVFTERGHGYLNELHLFIAHFNTIPNLISEIQIDCKRANKWFTELYKNEVRGHYYSKRYFDNKKQAEPDDIFYFLYDDLLVDFDTANNTARFLFHSTPLHKVQEIIDGIKKFKKRKTGRQPVLSLLVNTAHGIGTRELDISRPKLNIEDNYNNDFREVHDIILKRLSKKNDKGIVLLHGKPGTGKTSYIRYLICCLKKDVIFLPPDMAGAITNPNLMTVLIDNPNSVFVEAA